MQITKVSEYHYFSKRKGEEVGKGDYSDTWQATYPEGNLEHISIFLFSNRVWLRQLWDMEFSLCLSPQFIHLCDRQVWYFVPPLSPANLVTCEPELGAIIARIKTSHETLQSEMQEPPAGRNPTAFLWNAKIFFLRRECGQVHVNGLSWKKPNYPKAKQCCDHIAQLHEQKQQLQSERFKTSL